MHYQNENQYIEAIKLAAGSIQYKNLSVKSKIIVTVSQLYHYYNYNKNVKYLDVQTALVNSEGYLPEETSPDGIHIGAKYCEKWLDYLKNNS